MKMIKVGRQKLVSFQSFCAETDLEGNSIGEMFRNTGAGPFFQVEPETPCYMLKHHADTLIKLADKMVLEGFVKPDQCGGKPKRGINKGNPFMHELRLRFEKTNPWNGFIRRPPVRRSDRNVYPPQPWPGPAEVKTLPARKPSVSQSDLKAVEDFIRKVKLVINILERGLGFGKPKIV